MSQAERSHLIRRARRRLAVFVITLLLATVSIHVLIAARYSDHAQRHFLLQADSLLHGHLDIEPTGLTDVAYANGHAFVPFPPGPALILLPFVAVFGVDHVNATLVAVVLALVTLWAFFRILAHLDINASNRAWLAAAFFLGTGYWSALAQSSQVWYFAHIVAVALMVLALEEALGHRRAWLAAFYIGLAFLSRQLAISAAPVVAVLLWLQAKKGSQTPYRSLAAFGVVLTGAVAGYLAFNAARFGSPLDTGYAHIRLTGFLGARVARYGLFNLAYVPFNFVQMFLQGWHLDFGGPLAMTPMGVNPFGVSLLAASPFLLLSLWARNHRLLRTAVWCSVGTAVIVMLLYYNNGWAQINSQRFSLDFLPALFLLVLDVAPRVDSKIFKGTVAYAVGLNVLTLVVIPLLT